jgi:hypothetical protein
MTVLLIKSAVPAVNARKTIMKYPLLPKLNKQKPIIKRYTGAHMTGSRSHGITVSNSPLVISVLTNWNKALSISSNDDKLKIY